MEDEKRKKRFEEGLYLVKLENRRRKLLRCRGEEDGSGNADRFEGMSLSSVQSLSGVRLFATP